MRNGMIITSLEELKDYASKNDGECAVGKDFKGRVRVFDTGEEAQNEDSIVTWDYYFSDEAELFQENEYF